MNNSSVILVDLDGTIADFETRFFELITSVYPHITPVEVHRRTHPSLNRDYPGWDEEIGAIIRSRGFFRTLNPFPDGVAAVKEMHDLGYNVKICTAPARGSTTSVTEKLEWVEEHLGSEFISKVITASDKTLIHGKVLIDDIIQVGARKPDWIHLLIKRPTNRAFTVAEDLQMDWSEWKDKVLKQL